MYIILQFFVLDFGREITASIPERILYFIFLTQTKIPQNSGLREHKDTHQYLIKMPQSL
jgi:hypothetical protein